MLTTMAGLVAVDALRISATPPGRRAFTEEELAACTCVPFAEQMIADDFSFDQDCPTHGAQGPSR